MEGILEPPVDVQPVDSPPSESGERTPPSRTPYPIRTLVTDIENIVVDVRPWEPWLIAQLQAAGIDVEHVLLRWHRSELLRCANAGLIPIWEAWHDFLRTVGTPVGWTEELVIGIRGRYESSFSNCRLHPDLAAAFREFQDRSIQLAVLADSHWRQEELERVMHQIRFPVDVCYAATTAMLGASGPDSGPFAGLMQHLAIPPHRGAYLGWNRRSLEAARRADLISVSLHAGCSTEADIDLRDARELLQHLVPCEDPVHQQAA